MENALTPQIEELRESSEKVESLVKELESTKEKLEATTQELDITVSERNASEEKLEAANARIESLKNELQSVSQAPGPGGAHGLPDSEENKDPHSPQADKDGNYASLSAAQYLSTLKVNKDIDTSSVMETLSSTLPVLSKAVASKQRGCLLPLFSAVMATHTSSEARRVLGQQMLHLIKKPSEEDQLQILKSVEKLLGKSSNVDAENELLPHVLTMATHRSSERRVLAGRLCGALAPHLSERRVDSVLATLNLLCEDEDTDVIAGVAAGATCVVLSLRKLYMDNAWSSSNPKGNAGLTALRGPVRRQFAELEDLMWRFLIQGPDTTVYGGTTQTANAFGLHGSMQRCIREALTKVDENIDPSSGHVKFDDSFREVGTTLYGDLSLKDSWHIVVKYLLPNMLEWAWELGILWSALLPQFMDLVVDVETSIEHEEKDNDSSHRSGSRGNSSRRGSSSAAPSDSHSAEMSGSYVQDYGVARSQQGSRKMSMEDVQKTEWLVSSFIYMLPILHHLVITDHFTVLHRTTHEVFSISSEFFGKNDTEADLEVIDLNRYLREEPEDLPEEKPLLRCKFFDAVLDGRIVMVEKGTSDKIKDKTEDEILQVISETAFSLQKLSIKCNGYKWLVDTLVPEVFYASFTAPTTTAAGRRIRFAYGSILRAACLAFGNMFTLHFVYPLFLHGLDLKFPDFKRMGVQRTSVDIHELCKEKGIQNITLADYFDCGVLSTAVKTGTEERDFMGVTEEDDQTNFSEQDSRLQRYAWIHYIDRLCWLYSLESSSGQKVNEGSQASYGASNAPFLLPLFGSGTLSVPSLPRSAVAYSIRELLQVVSQKKAGWNATIHTPLVEQCVLSAGAFGGREVMEHLLTTLQRIGSNPSEFVRQCVAGMLSGILGNLDVSLLKKHGVTLVRQLADDEEVSVARIAVRAVTSLYSLKVAMDDKSIRKEVNDVIENTLKSGPTELVVETLRCLMRCVNNAPGELREGFILDKLLETSNALVAASRSDAFKNYGDSNIDSLPLWPGARIDDLEEVAMVCLEAYRAYTSMAGLLSQESKEMIADAVSSLLNDNELLDASYRDMMQASLGSAVTEMREGKVQPEDKHESGVGDFAPVQPTRAEASHEEQPEEFRQAAEAGNVFLAAMKGENFGGDSSASGSDSAAKESSENRSSGRFNKMKARLGFRGKKAS